MGNSSYQLYRCKTDGKLVFSDEIENHNGHRLELASEGTILEWLKVRWKKYKNTLKRREHYQ